VRAYWEKQFGTTIVWYGTTLEILADFLENSKRSAARQGGRFHLIPMALGKIQTQIVAKLEEWGRLTAEQRTEIVARPEDFSGEALDKLLQEDYKVAPFQLLTAKAARSASRPTM